uniref:A superfamily conotoxin Co1.5 n=3 Tax=Conus TaxID=6490 RepID=S4UJU9_CONCS|nr:A superfamily conotoxin Co1.5 precursor [Conus coronatus]AGK23164.1 A superfamily conotoxin Lv1.13 precursor [Conus lividus]AGK23173.1 A superfamily conotoxin Eb1.6 precursor [Conus ebraeus]
MGMRMMFTMFLLVVLAIAVVSFTSDRASDGRNDAAKAFHRIALTARTGCCEFPYCAENIPELCGGRR